MCSTPGGKQMVMLPCHHMACRECMLRNLTEGPKAPLCRVCHPHKMCVCGADKATFWISGTGPGYKVKLWCKDCRPAEAIDKAKTSKGRLCVCHKTRPRFGLPGQDQSEAQWCSKCRPDGAVDLARRPDQPVTIKACRCGSGRVPTLGLVDSSGKSVFRGPQKWCTRCPDIPPDAFPVGKWRCECGRKQVSGDSPRSASPAAVPEYCLTSLSHTHASAIIIAVAGALLRSDDTMPAHYTWWLEFIIFQFA